MTISLLSDYPDAPTAANSPCIWSRLHGAAYSLGIAEAAQRHAGLTLLITQSVHEAFRLEHELRFYCALSGLEILLFPDWETLPYDLFSPHQDIVSQRLSVLYTLPALTKGILIVSITTLMQKLAPRSFIQHHSLLLNKGDVLDMESFRNQLTHSGYQMVSQVMEHGEFAIRGSLIDLFPSGSAVPYRIDLFDNIVDSIKLFDCISQRSTETIDHIHMLPAREFPLNDEGISTFRSHYRNRFTGNPQQHIIYREISNGIPVAGCEYYLPLFFEHTETLLDYLPRHTLIVQQDNLYPAMEAFWEQITERHEQRRYNSEHPILEPRELFLNPDEIRPACGTYPAIELHAFEQESLNSLATYSFDTQTLPPLAIQHHNAQPAAQLQNFADQHRGRILFTAESAGRREALLDMLRKANIQPRSFEHWSDWQHSTQKTGIIVAPFDTGCLIGAKTKSPFALITEQQLLGKRATQQRRRKFFGSQHADAIINNLTALSIGAPVVHEENGVGRYLGLQILEVGGITTEFLTLEYAGGDKLYVPVSSLHLISRYSGASPDKAPLHKLGTEQWQRAKQKAAQKTRDVAAELLDIYARRAAQNGNSYTAASEDLSVFTAQFPFEETADQQTAIDAVLADMASIKPMDRVICGDVGFGKTEVAMRAGFVAVQCSKQVAVLVPTTLLAQQHYQNFSDRYADWPVRIECLSRFSNRKQQNAVIADLADGKIDIIIGTHKLLQKDVRFKDLGLIIIDEEHRFGVRHKEALKQLRVHTDILTLTATPIPRTLNMAMSGLRDLSIIATPPENRTSIKTFINEWNPALIQEACQRELKRGGQIYFIHNAIDTINQTAEKLRKMLPEAHIAIAHGQLPERELETIMLDFYHQRYNLLVCTTIIESGIDVPTANTILINRADHFGLAQLHQLRGRVGRSHHNAYAYLIVPPINSITADARKRLEAIESLQDLGAGFMLASHDLEIRGAGELLGDEQSGQIEEIGFTLYTDMLERAVKALQRGEDPLLNQPLSCGTEIDLGVPALLPDHYIPDVHTRLVLYKRIANAENPDQLKELNIELIDRFGLLPEPAKNLFTITELKLRIGALGVKKIDINSSGGRIEFDHAPRIDTAKLIRLIQINPKKYVFDGKNKLRFHAAFDSTAKKTEFVETLFTELAIH